MGSLGCQAPRMSLKSTAVMNSVGDHDEAVGLPLLAVGLPRRPLTHWSVLWIQTPMVNWRRTNWQKQSRRYGKQTRMVTGQYLQVKLAQFVLRVLVLAIERPVLNGNAHLLKTND